MGKKTREKGAKKEKDDKLKNEHARKAAAAVKEALEGVTLDKSATSSFRTVVGKKSERSWNVKVGCVESFRWESKQSPPMLPPGPAQTALSRMSGLRNVLLGGTDILWFQQLGAGWETYLSERFGRRSAAQKAQLDAASKSTAFKDGLSGPLTIVFLVFQHNCRKAGEGNKRGAAQNLNTNEPLHIVVVGASAVNEEKILKETNYWDEVGNLLAGRRVRLYLTGLEMSGNYSLHKTDERRTPVECWKGSAADFFLQSGRMDMFQEETTYVVSLNPGFGAASNQVGKIVNRDVPSADVMWNWLPSLFFLAALDLPLLFTASSREGFDHMAVVLQRIVGLYSLGLAAEAPLPFASAVPVGEGQQDVRANSYMITAQGRQPGRYGFSSCSITPDTRTDNLRRILRQNAGRINKPPLHPTMLNAPFTTATNDLAPLKRYGNYPPKAAAEAALEAKKLAILRRTAETLLDVQVELEAQSTEGVDERGEGEDLEEGWEEEEKSAPECLSREKSLTRIHLDYSIDICSMPEGEDEVVMLFEGVYMADPSTARVGVRRSEVALFYTDCRDFEEVTYNTCVGHDLDHTTTKVIFHPSTAAVEIRTRLASTPFCD